MLIYDKIMFAASTVLLLLLMARARRVPAQDSLDALVFRRLRFGTSMTALSYLFRILDYGQPHHVSAAGTIFCLAGTIAIVSVVPDGMRLMQRARDAQRRERTAAEARIVLRRVDDVSAGPGERR